jgi:hypothetical protein
MYHLNLTEIIINNTIKDTIITLIYQCTVLIRLDKQNAMLISVIYNYIVIIRLDIHRDMLIVEIYYSTVIM